MWLWIKTFGGRLRKLQCSNGILNVGGGGFIELLMSCWFLKKGSDVSNVMFRYTFR